MKTDFHNKDVTLSLALIWRLKKHRLKCRIGGRSLAFGMFLALFHISKLNNGMRYQTVLEQVTLQSSKGIYRE